jgi:8-oxo-dGTP pyrophosphatase MutT (NUDIX family)
MTSKSDVSCNLSRQIEDIRVEGTKKWRRGLAMFGGKVQQEDADWLETAAREFAEETGGLVCDQHSGKCRR